MKREMLMISCTLLLLAPVEAAKPFSQPVSGTTLSIEMIPMPGEDGKSQRWVSRHEVTWDLYDALVYRLDVPKGTDPADGGVTRPTKPYLMADRGWGHAGFPALSVSHRGAEAWCAWMTAKTDRVWRLPTEDEWKLLCSASGTTPSNMSLRGWHKENANKRTHAVGTAAPDALGLNDLAGNVAEWCVTKDGKWVLMGTCYADETSTDPCNMRREPIPEWNDTDPQIPKSIWWLSDAPFAGFRVICEQEVEEDDGTSRQEKSNDDT